MKTPHYPYSQSNVALVLPCRACGYGHGLLIIRSQDDRGFVRCGRCDSAQYAVEQIEEVVA